MILLYPVPEKQRALILQGGGALGAYQVGVLKVLYKYLIEKGNYNKGGSLFDIIIGTSIGAMNAAVLVGNFVNKNMTWDDAIKELEKTTNMVCLLPLTLANGGRTTKMISIKSMHRKRP